MLNIILPIVQDAEKFNDFIKRVNSKNVKFFVGVKNSLATFISPAKNVEIHVFNDKSNKEEIINSLHSCKLEKGKILIARRPLTDEEFKNICLSQADIVTLKANHNRFVRFLKDLSTKIVKRFFAFSFFEDISAICYGENMFELISVCSNLSMASRINKYVGVELEEVVTSEKSVKKDYNRGLNLLKFAFWCLILLGSITGGVLICVYNQIQVLIGILIAFWIITALIIWCIGLINFTRTIAVGNLRYGRAEEKF